jgi:hypothetical protein
MFQLARLQSVIFDIHTMTMRIFTYGNLTALNKLSEADQATRVEQGLEPKVRPINSGSVFLAAAVKAVTTSAEGKAAAERLAPIQCGLARENGPEVVCHTLRDAYARGCIIFTQDAANAFNTLSRTSMAQAVRKTSPAISRAFEATYDHAATISYITRDRMEGTTTVHCMESQTGARMGDTFGSLVFDITLAPTYEKVQKAVPTAIVLALTDDMPAAPTRRQTVHGRRPLTTSSQ